jgi:hypothetical protein
MDGPKYNDDLDNNFISEEWQFMSDAARAKDDDDDSDFDAGSKVNFFIDDDDDGDGDAGYGIWETDEDGEFVEATDDTDNFDDGFISDEDEDEIEDE